MIVTKSNKLLTCERELFHARLIHSEHTGLNRTCINRLANYSCTCNGGFVIVTKSNKLLTCERELFHAQLIHSERTGPHQYYIPTYMHLFFSAYVECAIPVNVSSFFLYWR